MKAWQEFWQVSAHLEVTLRLLKPPGRYNLKQILKKTLRTADLIKHWQIGRKGQVELRS